MTTSNSNTQVDNISLKPSKKQDKRKRAISRLKRRVLKHLWLVRISLVIGTVIGIYLLLLLIGLVFKQTKLGLYAGLASDFMFTPSEKIESQENRINILILGKGGEEHSAPDLTDTIIFASVNIHDPKLILLSLPRDIWISSLRAKLNSAYYWGNQREPPAHGLSGSEGGGGLILAKSEVEKIVGGPVHYGVVVDFSGFKKIIDELEGIEVGIDRSFTDEHYPITGKENDECDGDPEYKCRYETVSFEKGIQLMDGETALKFARSRNAQGDEGTDFARAARQEKVMEAIKNELLSRETILNPKKTIKVVNVILESVETDASHSASVIMARYVFEARDNIYSHVLPEKLLENPPQSKRYDNLYVFIPKGGVWDQVHQWVKCVLKNGECD